MRKQSQSKWDGVARLSCLPSRRIDAKRMPEDGSFESMVGLSASLTKYDRAMHLWDDQSGLSKTFAPLLLFCLVWGGSFVFWGVVCLVRFGVCLFPFGGGLFGCVLRFLVWVSGISPEDFA